MATAQTEIKVTPEIAAEHGVTREEYARKHFATREKYQDAGALSTQTDRASCFQAGLLFPAMILRWLEIFYRILRQRRRPGRFRPAGALWAIPRRSGCRARASDRQ